jgi:hypothetical protein
VGMDYLVQNIEFGPASRTLVQSALFSFARQFSPSVSLSVFGGPQYLQLDEQFSLPLGSLAFQPPFSSTQWNWAAGGALTKRLDNIVFQLTAQHEVTNGGGLLGAVVNSSIGATVRHRLARDWDVIWTAGYADNASLDSTISHGGYRSLNAGVGVQRTLTEKLSLGFRYDFVHQGGTGQSPLLGNFNRDLWSVQLSYRFREIALGR